MIACEGGCGLSYPKKEIKYTFRNGRNRPLCPSCWELAKQAQQQNTPPNRAEEAKKEYIIRKLFGG